LKNKSNETLTAKPSFLEKLFYLIKMEQKYFSDGSYKTQVRNYQFILENRILPS